MMDWLRLSVFHLLSPSLCRDPISFQIGQSFELPPSEQWEVMSWLLGPAIPEVNSARLLRFTLFFFFSFFFQACRPAGPSLSLLFTSMARSSRMVAHCCRAGPSGSSTCHGGA